MTRPLFLALVPAVLGACQSQTAETPTRPVAAPPPPAMPAAKPPVRRPETLDWPAGHVDTLQPRTMARLPFVGSTRTAFNRLPKFLPDTIIDEANLLRLAGAGVRREGRILRLPLCQGSQELVTFDQTDNPDSTVRYTFAGALPGANQWVVATTLWEGFYVMLVDRCSGRRHYAWNYPVPSPNQKYFAVVNSDLDAHYSPTGMQLWAATPTGVRKIWQREWPEDTDNGPAEVRWLNEHTVILKQKYFEDQRAPRYVALDLNRLVKP